MKLLLDTHAFLWFYLGDQRLSAVAIQAIQDPTHEKLVSAAVYWEVAIKVGLGKLQFAVPYQHLVDDGTHQNGFKVLPIETRHCSVLAALPLHHRDPFDRMLIAQAMVEQMSIVSKDEALDAYGVPRIW